MKPVSSSALEVSWEAPTESCSANEKYNIEYSLTNRDQCKPSDSNKDIVTSVFGTNITLTDLYPYSSYEIRVSASGGVQTVSAMTDEAGGLLRASV